MGCVVFYLLMIGTIPYTFVWMRLYYYEHIH